MTVGKRGNHFLIITIHYSQRPYNKLVCYHMHLLSAYDSKSKEIVICKQMNIIIYMDNVLQLSEINNCKKINCLGLFIF